MTPDQFDWLGDHIGKEELLALGNLREQAKRILSEPVLYHYTDHSISHSDRVLNILRLLVADNLATQDDEKRLNDLELMILVGSTYLHDIGMQTPIFEQEKLEKCEMDHELAERVRASHASLSALMVEKNLSPDRGDYPVLGLDQNQLLQDVSPYIQQVVEHHNTANPPLDTTDSIYSKPIRIGLLTGLFRLADSLDLAQNRVDMEKIKRFKLPLESQIHWWRHHYVKSVMVEDGMIRLHLCFSTDLSSPHIDYFKNLILDEISKEMELSWKVLYTYNIRFRLDENVLVSHDDRWAKAALPKRLREFIDTQLAKSEAGFAELASSLGKTTPVQISEDDWVSFWKFKGNPWEDMPLQFKDVEFVETQSIRNLVSELSALTKGKRGSLRLLVGERGSGKTTFFNVLKPSLKSGDLDVHYVDITESLIDIKHPSQLYNLVFGSIQNCLSIEKEQRFSERKLREALRHPYAKKGLVSIDNLDKFDEGEEMEIVQQFFKISQTLFSDIKRKCVVVVSCSPKWRDMLEHRDLSYLGFRNSWLLASFGESEVRRLLSNRLLPSSLSFGDVFDDDVIPPIRLMSGGTPRQVVQIAEDLCMRGAAKKIEKVDKDFLESELSQEILETARNQIDHIARQSRYFGEALSMLYAFNEEMERSKLNTDRGWKYFLTILESPQDIESVEEEYRHPLAFVVTRFSKRIEETTVVDLIPRKQVKELIERSISSGMTLNNFVSAYRLKPFVPHGHDPTAVFGPDPETLVEGAKEYFEEAKSNYERLTSMTEAPLKTIQESWDTIQLLLQSLLIQYGFMSKDDVEAKKKKDDLGRTRMTREERVKESFYYTRLLPRLAKTTGYIRHFEDINFLQRKRNKVLKTPTRFLMDFTDKDAELCLLSLKKVYGELCRLLPS